MAQVYAGVLGLVAFVTVLVRGMIHGADPDSVLFAAWCSLLVFTATGCVLGWIAGRIVEESVRATIAAEVAARHAHESPAPPGTSR